MFQNIYPIDCLVAAAAQLTTLSCKTSAFSFFFFFRKMLSIFHTHSLPTVRRLRLLVVSEADDVSFPHPGFSFRGFDQCPQLSPVNSHDGTLSEIDLPPVIATTQMRLAGRKPISKSRPRFLLCTARGLHNVEAVFSHCCGITMRTSQCGKALWCHGPNKCSIEHSLSSST